MNPDVFAPIDLPRSLQPYFRRGLAANLNDPIDMVVTIHGTGYCYLGLTESGRWQGHVNNHLIFDTDTHSRVHLSGQVFDSDIICRSSGVVKQIFLEFTATGQYEFLGVPGEKTYEYVLAPESISAEFETLTKSLFASESEAPFEQRFLMALEGFKPASRKVPKHVQQLVNRIEASEGSESLNDVFADLDISERKARHDFSHIVGLTPKRFSKLLQINTALGELIGLGEERLSSVAQSAGFSDQAHMTRDFAKFLGDSPVRFSKDIEPTLKKFVGHSRMKLGIKKESAP